MLALTASSQGHAQERNVEGLRGTGANVADGDLTPATGTARRASGGLTGATAASSPEKIDPVDLTAPNYGKPRKRVEPRTRFSGQRKTTGKPLPPLQPYASAAATRQQRATPGKGAPPAPTVATVASIPAKTRPKVEADPYAPIGVGVGSLRLVPYVDVSSGYDSNPNRVAGAAGGSATTRGEIGASWKSDWSAHELKGDFKAGYSKYYSAADASRPDAQGKLDLRVDATRDAAFDFQLRGQLDTQRPNSTELPSTKVKGRPLTLTSGATAGGTQKIGNLELALHGTLDRTGYEDATLNNGAKLPLSGNSFNAYGARVRVGYQVTPGVAPFVEAGGDLRRRDQSIDSAGFKRDSSGGSAKIGSTFELTRTLTGETSVGYAQRRYSDSRLPLLAGATLDAALVWTASPLTSVSLRGATTLAETTVANASGAVNRALTIDVSHALLRNLTLGAAGTFGVNEYKGVTLRENTFSGTLRAEYLLNRGVSVRGSFTHERLQSTNPGSDYTANVFLLGLKLQR